MPFVLCVTHHREDDGRMFRRFGSISDLVISTILRCCLHLASQPLGTATCPI